MIAALAESNPRPRRVKGEIGHDQNDGALVGWDNSSSASHSTGLGESIRVRIRPLFLSHSVISSPKTVSSDRAVRVAIVDGTVVLVMAISPFDGV